MRNFVRVAPALLLLAALALLGLAPASSAAAASEPERLCSSVGLTAAAKDADAVVLGMITSADDLQADGGQSATLLQVSVERVYSGQVERRIEVEGRDQSGTQGSLPQDRGLLLFLTEVDGGWQTTPCARPIVAEAPQLKQVERLLGDGEEPSAGEVQVEFSETSAGSSEPVSMARSVAPGVALVLVGLLGLLVTGSLGRRR